MKLVKFVLFALIALGCTQDKDSLISDPLLIGEFSSLTGTESSFGQSTHKGIQLAVEEINNSGGVHGQALKVISLDNKSQTDVTTKVVEELIHKHKVLALLGEVASSRSLLAAPIAQKNKIPMLSPSSTNPRVTEVGNYIFRACYVDPFQGEVMANFAFNKLKVKKVAVIKDKRSEYSRSLANFFVKTYRNLGGRIVANENYKSGDIDFKDQLSFIRTENPQAIFIPGYYTEAALIARQARKLGIKAHFLGGDGWDSPRLFEIGKDSVNGAYFTNHYFSGSDLPKSKEFVRNYRNKYKMTPDGVAAMAYDATYILAEAMKKSKKVTPENIRQQLTEINNFPGVTGDITIDKSRNGIKPSVIVKVDGPMKRFVTSVLPDKPKKSKETEL